MLVTMLVTVMALPAELSAALPAAIAVSNVLRVIMIGIAETVNKPPTESVMFEKYARIASVIDEVVNEVSG